MKWTKHFKTLGLATLLSAFVFLACEEEFISVEDLNIEKDYFPLEVGNFVIYQLDSIIYDDFSQTDTTISLLVRELVEDTFIDAGGRTAYRLERAYKRNENDVWGQAGFNIWSAFYNGNNAEKVEENQRYLKLAFPLGVGKTWPGNQYINTDPIDDGSIDSTIESPLLYLEGWSYEVATLNEPFSINGLTFDSTTTIIQEEFGIATDTIGAREIYAKGVGLILKELWLLSSQCSACNANNTPCLQDCFTSPWIDRAEAGVIVRQEILEYGKL